MTVAQRTFEKITNIEKKLWAISPVWLFGVLLSVIITTASVVWAAVNYDNRKNADIAKVSTKVDNLKRNFDEKHFRDSVIAESRYNYMLTLLAPKQRPVKKNQVKGYTAVKRDSAIIYIAKY